MVGTRLNRLRDYHSESRLFCLVFRCHLKTRPFDNQTTSYHSNPRHVRYSDGYCMIDYPVDVLVSFSIVAVQNLIADTNSLLENSIRKKFTKVPNKVLEEPFMLKVTF